MLQFRDVQPHGKINEVLPNVYMVTGTNTTRHDGVDIQTSRNMVIIKENDALTLINTVRLNEEGLAALDKLGEVKHVARIGAFHGYDDAFYVDRYKPKFWAVKGMKHENDLLTDAVLTNDGPLPFSNCTVFNFETTEHPECMLLYKTDAGTILITCDSIQNWTKQDPYFSDETYTSFKQQGLIAEANIPDTWIGACKPKADEMAKIKTLNFQFLLSAHGTPLKEEAYEKVCSSIKLKFGL